jgi:hypothetical protein
MPECATAHTHVQRALHALILEDSTGAAGYLRRALCCLEEEGGKETIHRQESKRRRGGFEEGGRSIGAAASTFQWDWK